MRSLHRRSPATITWCSPVSSRPKARDTREVQAPGVPAMSNTPSPHPAACATKEPMTSRSDRHRTSHSTLQIGTTPGVPQVTPTTPQATARQRGGSPRLPDRLTFSLASLGSRVWAREPLSALQYAPWNAWRSLRLQANLS
ncbi:hypothetical protein BU26DRAFT_202988 [Trematosphaeria pertusa]|uniref:Uncharacterized protein n=1 Tax=Trematosphaeria pertusa TaxID=390896 RepID=A0A6A6HSU1_9PLEO|nr:uncharacterized protein BU26DRAFT_202988 [Trematosphaeria pertusa]KAF2240593.1 hypothetical protein BU26DRAFT_202988 [Trematosphaeria pertusa]